MGIELYGIKNLICPSAGWTGFMDHMAASRDHDERYILGCIMQHEWDGEYDRQVDILAKSNGSDGAMLIAANQSRAWSAVADKAKEEALREQRGHGGRAAAGCCSDGGGDCRHVPPAGRRKGAGRRSKRKA